VSGETEFFCFQTLPMGMSLGAYALSEAMKAVTRHLRAKGITCSYYLDVAVLIAKPKEDLHRVVLKVLVLYRELGLFVNMEKSALFPAQKAIYLGLEIDSDKETLAVPPKKRADFLEKTEKAASGRDVIFLVA
jgi:hypothetical protein